MLNAFIISKLPYVQEFPISPILFSLTDIFLLFSARLKDEYTTDYYEIKYPGLELEVFIALQKI